MLHDFCWLFPAHSIYSSYFFVSPFSLGFLMMFILFLNMATTSLKIFMEVEYPYREVYIWPEKSPSCTTHSPHESNHYLDFLQCSLPFFFNFKYSCLRGLSIVLYVIVRCSCSLPCSIPVRKGPWLIYLLYWWWAVEWLLVGVHSGWCCCEHSSTSLDEYMDVFLLDRYSGATLLGHRICMCVQFL